MGGGTHPEIPNWKIYKVEDAPELVKLQKRLAADGLKDPWIRNEVWRYDKRWSSVMDRAKLFFFRGFKWGLVLAVGHASIKYAFFPDKHAHHDH